MSEQDLASIDGEITLRHAIAWASATWRRRITLGLVVVVPLVVALAGGFAPASDRSLPELAPGEAVELGPYDLVLEEFFVSDEVRTSSLPDDAEAWLGVVATVTGTADEATPLHHQALTFPEGLVYRDGEPQQNPTHRDMLRTADGELIHDYSSGLTVDIVTLLPVRDAAAVPEEITVELTEMESAWSSMLQMESWYEQEHVGEVALARTEVIPPELLEEGLE